MRILITGAGGFIGRNLVCALRENGYDDLLLYDINTPPALLKEYCKSCAFVFHLAGVNRPEDPADFMRGNRGFTETLLDALRESGNACPVMLSSSTQAALDNPYGESKRAGERLILDYGRETGATTYVFRFPNVFGKWSRPNYNSAVATFCHNVARDLPIKVNDPSAPVTLVYIDDVVAALLATLHGEAVRDGDFCIVRTCYPVLLGDVVARIRSFRALRDTRELPDMDDPLTRKLYATYTSFLPRDGFAYPLLTHADARGSFTEFLRMAGGGQVSVNVSKPGIAKGDHWHHTKTEKFLVVSGEGVIRFRAPDENEILEYPVSDRVLTVVDIPTGYTHSIINTGRSDMVTLMWASERFDPTHPDTLPLKVE